MFSFFKKKMKSSEPAPMIIPRIKHQNFLDAINSIEGMTDSSRPVVESLGGDLLLTYAIDVGSNYMMLTSDCLDRHHLKKSELRKMAEANGLEAMRNIEVCTDGIVHELTAPDNMGACTILYPELWRQIEKEVGSPIVAAFPHREVTLYATDNAQGIEAIYAIINQFNFEDNHALSKLIFRPSSHGWKVVPAPQVH